MTRRVRRWHVRRGFREFYVWAATRDDAMSAAVLTFNSRLRVRWINLGRWHGAMPKFTQREINR